jgi:2-keto-3-deoxy-galactonokinase
MFLWQMRLRAEKKLTELQLAIAGALEAGQGWMETQPYCVPAVSNAIAIQIDRPANSNLQIRMAREFDQTRGSLII